MLSEADNSLCAMELNRFVDSILDIVYKVGSDRRIVFTAFSWELCIVLAAKQETYPVLFLANSINCPTGNTQATSTQTAVRFAQRFGLAGVVMESEPLVASPRLVKLIKGRGLFSASYGPLNNEPKNAMASEPPQFVLGLPLLMLQWPATYCRFRQKQAWT